MSETIKTTNPYNESVLNEYKIDDQKSVDQALIDSMTAFKDWKTVSSKEKASLLLKAAEVLESDISCAELITKEMGKPLKESKAEILKCALVCRHYAEIAQESLQDRVIDENSFVTYQPLGPILAVMPWNFPFWQVFRFLAPTLFAGNVALLKHASNVTGSALAIEEILLKAGFPKGVFKTLVLPSKDVESLIKDFRIRGVSFTGSTEVGRKIAAWSGESLKPSLLELGGNDAYLIHEDYDLKTALKVVVDGRFSNTGQSCIAAKRVFVPEDKKDEAVGLLKEILNSLKFGDPSDETTSLGTLAKREFKEELDSQVKKAIEHGAEYTLLKEAPRSSKAFLDCGLLTNINSKNPIKDEELFGPVLSLYTYKSVDEAIEVANSSSFGLGGAVFSNDLDWAKEVASTQLESGSVFINQKVSSNPLLPFGGIKNSGYGRELSNEALFAFVNVKSVSIK